MRCAVLFAAVTSTASAASSTGQKYYCPQQKDLAVAYTDVGSGPGPTIKDQGWHFQGGGGVHSLASFNLLGGYVEFDVDLGNVKSGVNANVYAISPRTFQSASGFNKQNDYCDGSEAAPRHCLEVDWLEANGHCGAAVSIHAIKGPGEGCTAWGCTSTYTLKSTQYKMRVEYAMDGKVTVSRNGHRVDDISPDPGRTIWDIVKARNENHGTVIYSSEWTGWVPREDCGTSGDLRASSMTVSNLIVYGAVVQGPTPAVCGTKPVSPRRRRTPTPTRRRRRSNPNCASDTEDCRAARCCKSQGKSCYEKDSTWASCRGSCTPGINPYDPKEYQTPWTCHKITGLDAEVNASNYELI